MTEKALEQKLKKEIEKLGGNCVKLVSPGFTGMPDRLILMPAGKVYFVEVKKPDGKLSERQETVLKQLQASGHSAHWIDSEGELRGLLQFIKIDTGLLDYDKQMYGNDL